MGILHVTGREVGKGKVVLKRKALKTSLKAGKGYRQGRSQMLSPRGEMRSCCLLTVKVHQHHESSEFMGDVQLMTS